MATKTEEKAAEKDKLTVAREQESRARDSANCQGLR